MSRTVEGSRISSNLHDRIWASLSQNGRARANADRAQPPASLNVVHTTLQPRLVLTSHCLLHVYFTQCTPHPSPRDPWTRPDIHRTAAASSPGSLPARSGTPRDLAFPHSAFTKTDASAGLPMCAYTISSSSSVSAITFPLSSLLRQAIPTNCSITHIGSTTIECPHCSNIVNRL